jgi:hypothetical protein
MVPAMLVPPVPRLAATPLLAEIRTEMGEWRWADLPPAWVLALLVIAAFLGLRWLYRRERGRSSPARRLFLAGVRTLVLLAVLLILSGPYREEVVTSEEKSHLVVLIDTSASMKNEDAYPDEEEQAILAAAWPDEGDRPARLASAAEKSRLALVKRVLTANSALVLRRLGEMFVLHVFAFDEDWRSLGTTEPVTEESRDGAGPGEPHAAIAAAIRGLEARGPRTRIGAALRNVAAQFLGRQDQRFGGVVLITDGQDTSEGEPPLEVLTSLAGARGLKVTSVGLGNPDSDKNLRVEPIRAKDVVLVRDQVMFDTALRHKGLEGVERVTAEMTIHRIRDGEGNKVEPPARIEPGSDGRAKLRMEAGRLPDEETPQPVRLWAPFDEAGTYRIRIEAKLPPTHERLDAILDDNAATHDLLVKDQSIRVLFVDREARYEWRFLSNYLTRETPVRPTGGGAASKSRFLTHVLLQSGDPTVDQAYTRGPGMQARRYFPQTREELFAYDVLILGDVDLASLARSPGRKNEVLAMIRSFVEEGGGIALEAGVDLKNPLDFLGTPLADLLPVSAAEYDRKATDMEMPRPHPFRLRLSEAGRQHPAFNILPLDREGEPLAPERVARIWAGEDEAATLSEGWAWYWMYRPMGGLRPGAVALAHAFRPGVPDERSLLDSRDEPLVVFASMSFGRGRVFWSSIDDIWRMRRGQSDLYYGAFWEQVIRDLALYRLLGGNRRFKIFPKDAEVEVGDTAEIQILAQDERYRPMDARYLDGVHVELPDNAGRIDLEGDRRPESTVEHGGPPGEYRFRIPVDRAGTYLVWIEQKADVRDSGGRAEERFRGVTRAREDSLKLPDHRVLHEIARETDGRVVRLAGLSDLSLPAQTLSRVLDRRHRTQWDKAWVLFVLAGLLGLEWALRKRWQMI